MQYTRQPLLSDHIFFQNSVVSLETSSSLSMETPTDVAIYLTSSLFKKKKICLKKENLFLVWCTLFFFFSVNSKRVLQPHSLAGLGIPEVARSVLCQNVINHWQFVLAPRMHYLHTHLFTLCLVKSW